VKPTYGVRVLSEAHDHREREAGPTVILIVFVMMAFIIVPVVLSRRRGRDQHDNDH
jgi:hypothetical protein